MTSSSEYEILEIEQFGGSGLGRVVKAAGDNGLKQEEKKMIKQFAFVKGIFAELDRWPAQ